MSVWLKISGTMASNMVLWVAGVVLLASGCSSLDNGVGLTPPMGWLTWERFRCQSDCVNYPNDCISENLLKSMADAMVSEGYADVGYEYLIIDDCWMTHERDENNALVADPDRFPGGMAALADYIHSKGLKFGIYEDLGTMTCGGFPGSLDYKEIDANTFAAWGVDYVKFDGCNSDAADFDVGYPEFGKYLNATGRPIFYSCEWPLYQMLNGITPNYTAIRATCNMWRNYYDIDDSYESMSGSINWYGDHQDEFADFAGPGGWNDPDMIVVGNFALSAEESRMQMAIWAVMASPFIMSNDLRNMEPEFKALLQNKEIIAVNQDGLGIQGRRVYNFLDLQIWIRRVQPVVNGQASYAVAVINTRVGGSPNHVQIRLSDIGVVNADNFSVRDIFKGVDLPDVSADGSLDVVVAPFGAQFIKYQPK